MTKKYNSNVEEMLEYLTELPTNEIPTDENDERDIADIQMVIKFIDDLGKRDKTIPFTWDERNYIPEPRNRNLERDLEPEEMGYPCSDYFEIILNYFTQHIGEDKDIDITANDDDWNETGLITDFADELCLRNKTDFFTWTELIYWNGLKEWNLERGCNRTEYPF